MNTLVKLGCTVKIWARSDFTPGVRRHAESLRELVGEVLRRRIAADGRDLCGRFLRLLQHSARALASLEDYRLLDAHAEFATEGTVDRGVGIA